MQFQETDHPHIFLIKPKVFRDERGFFMETFRQEQFLQAGIAYEFVQENHSFSNKGVLRGLHYQLVHPQGRLVRAVRGEIFDVAVDLRRSSSRFGTWVGMILSAENHWQLWIPPGFAHGFYTLSANADVIYKTTDYYYPAGDCCIRWDDPNLAIDWPIPPLEREMGPILSFKDAAGSSLIEAEVYP